MPRSLVPALLLALLCGVLVNSYILPTHQPKNVASNLNRTEIIIRMVTSIKSFINSNEVFTDGEKGELFKCLSCKVVVSILNGYLSNYNQSKEEVAALIRKICIKFKIETSRVCIGVTTVFIDELIEVLTGVAITPDQICGLILGNSCAPVYNPFHNWSIPIPPSHIPVAPSVAPKENAPVLRVLHLSDTHFDPLYKEGYLADCGEPLCCRIPDGLAPSPDKAAGKWGDYRNCDTPLDTLENLLQHISKNHKFDYVIWTGDIPPHDIWNTTRTSTITTLHQVTGLLNKYLGTVPILPALGNHESSPVNSFPPPQITGQHSISWLYDELVDAWKDWLPNDALTTLREGAFYSVKIAKGFKIISLNMNYCNNMNWWLLLNSTDPANQLTWLVKELYLSELSGEKVHLIGHIPPGLDDCLKVWSHNFYKIVNRFESTIVAQFYGHTHFDEFEMFYDEDTLTRPLSVAYIGPSVTTYFGLNPSYRIYTVDGNYNESSWAVLDHETYIFNLTQANIFGEPVWYKEYSAKEDLGLQSLDPVEWNNLIARFEKDDQLFQKFYGYYYKKSDYHLKYCDAKCKHNMICRLKSGRSYDETFCPSSR